MWMFIGKTVVSALLISFVSYLSGKKTALAGFLTALPLTTLLALAFSQVEWGNSKQTVEFAKSVFLAVPISLLFFVPFLFSEKFNLGFWPCYIIGIIFLGIGYFIHTSISKAI
jgi:hypothetical protein